MSITVIPVTSVADRLFFQFHKIMHICIFCTYEEFISMKPAISFNYLWVTDNAITLDLWMRFAVYLTDNDK